MGNMYSSNGGDLDCVQCSGASDKHAIRVARKGQILYELASLGPLVAVDTGGIDCVGLEEIYVIIFNGNTTITRTPTFEFRKTDGTVMDSIVASAIAANARGRYAFGRGATATGITAGYAIPPPLQLRVTTNAPASGTGNGLVYVWGR